MQYKDSDLKCGLWEAGSSITIMHLLTQRSQLENSWQNLKFHNPSIHLTSPRPTFFYSLNSKFLYGRRFQIVEDIITNVMNDLQMIPQTSFKQRFQKWKRWWERCIAAEEDCFEGSSK
jgi:hypothetical protein